MKKIKPIIAGVVTIAVVALIIVMFNSGLFKTEVIESFNSSTLTTMLNEVSELTTYRHEYTNVIISKTQKQTMGMEIPWSEAIKLIKYQGYIKTGTDLSKVQVDADTEKKSVNIKLKKSTVLDNSVHIDKTVVEDVKGGIFSEYPSQTIIDEISKDKKLMEEQILKDGLLERSDTRLKSLVESMLKSYGFEKITIGFLE